MQRSGWTAGANGKVIIGKSSSECLSTRGYQNRNLRKRNAYIRLRWDKLTRKRVQQRNRMRENRTSGTVWGCRATGIPTTTAKISHAKGWHPFCMLDILTSLLFPRLFSCLFLSGNAGRWYPEKHGWPSTEAIVHELNERPEPLCLIPGSNANWTNRVTELANSFYFAHC